MDKVLFTLILGSFIKIYNLPFQDYNNVNVLCLLDFIRILPYIKTMYVGQKIEKRHCYLMI
jgi:hypothetical protein